MYDRLRPAYHLMPKENWMNDPNGLLYYRGKYHMFYQYNPRGDFWGTIHWGHAVSQDLMHWEHLPAALSPSEDLGEVHCYSGCTVIDEEGRPTIFYTSIGRGSRSPEHGAQQWMAKSGDGMITWRKSLNNPVMDDQLHKGADITFWRDPFLWKERDMWYAVLGGTQGGRGSIFLYQSSDLSRWKFINTLYQSGSHLLLECPNLLKFENKYVLIYSPVDAVRYHIGTINKEGCFVTETEGILDYGSGKSGFYAPNTLLNAPDGRKIMWGWLTEGARGAFKGIKGWSGVQSLPRILSLDLSGQLSIEPAQECRNLHFDPEYTDMRTLKEAHKVLLATKGRAYEISINAFLPGSGRIEIGILVSLDGRETTKIICDMAKETLLIDRTHSTVAREPHKSVIEAPLALLEGGRLKLRIFVDHSTVEIFANSRITMTARVYPILQESVHITAQITQEVVLEEFCVWKMKNTVK